MQKSNILKAFETTKAANAIIGKASTEILKTSYKTATQIASLYKDAGMEGFKIGKSVLTKSFKLTVKTQKELLATSGQAIKDTAKAIRESDIQLKADAKKKQKKAGKKAKSAKKEVTIDDLL